MSGKLKDEDRYTPYYGSYWWIVYWIKEVWASWIGTRSHSPNCLPLFDDLLKKGAAPKNFQNPNFRIHVNTVFLNFLTPVQQEQAEHQLHPKNFGMLEGSNYTFENWDDGGGRKWDKYFTILVYIASQASKLGVNFFQTYGKMARELSKQWPRSRTSRTESKILGRGQNSSDEICLQVVNSHHPLSSPSLYWIKISIYSSDKTCLVI